MEKLQNKPNKEGSKEENGFFSWLAEEDAPEIGIAVKEPLPEYAKGVVYEFQKITWPTRDQVTQEFINVIVIVAIISVAVYIFDLGFENFFSFFKGVIGK